MEDKKHRSLPNPLWLSCALMGAMSAVVLSLLVSLPFLGSLASQEELGSSSLMQKLILISLQITFAPFIIGFQTGAIIGLRRQRLQQFKLWYEARPNFKASKHKVWEELLIWILLGPIVGIILGAEFGILLASVIYPAGMFFYMAAGFFGAIEGLSMGIVAGLIVGVTRAVLTAIGGTALLRKATYTVSFALAFLIFLPVILSLPIPGNLGNGMGYSDYAMLYGIGLFAAIAAFQSNLFLSTLFDTKTRPEDPSRNILTQPLI